METISANIVVFCTCSSPEEGERVARGLVESRLAACVNLLPAVRSIYRWEGAVEDASECLLVIKTRGERLAELEAAIQRLHSYSVPEVIALPVAGGSEAYLRWLRAESAPEAAKSE